MEPPSEIVPPTSIVILASVSGSNIMKCTKAYDVLPPFVALSQYVASEAISSNSLAEVNPNAAGLSDDDVYEL